VLALLSPAKKLDWTTEVVAPDPTRPQLLDHVRELLDVARPLKAGDLRRLMGISDELAALNHERFQALDLDAGPDLARPALLAFAGDVYVGLDAKTLSPDDLRWAQDHVAVLSGLYGFLRPLDLIMPYRLEMGTKLENPRGRDLYAFWRGAVVDRVNDAVAGHADPTLVNLASQEYFKAVDRKRLAPRIVTPVFQDVKGGKARSLFLFVKRARGAMARWMIARRAERVEDLKAFDGLGYSFVPEASTGDTWVFRRPQPPPP
jgi:cytoplasmic iron level regulating protein YaaA (DUF328/UPF0246 family)